MIQVMIEFFTNEVIPLPGTPICFYFNGKWETGVYLEEFFYGQEYGKHKTFSIQASPDHVELWYYLPERDDL